MIFTVNVNVANIGCVPQKCQKYQIWCYQMFFRALNAPKLVFGRGSAPNPAGGAYDNDAKAAAVTVHTAKQWHHHVVRLSVCL